MRLKKIKGCKYILILSLMVLSASGCSSVTEKMSTSEESQTTTVCMESSVATTFQEIGSYSSNEKYDRLYSHYASVVEPSDSYGKIVPYLGDVIKFDYSSVVENFGNEEVFEIYARLESDGDVFTLQTFGLCTADGKIVTDPVYSQILYNDSYYLCTRLQNEENGPIYAITDFVSEDGSIVVNNQNEIPIYILDSTQIVNFYENGVYSYDRMTFYNSQGQIIENSKGFDIDQNGLRFEGIYDEATDVFSCYLTDASGKRVSAEYDYITLTDGGFYTANREKTSGILDSTGEIAVPCECSQILYENGMVACKMGNHISVYDNELTLQYEYDFSKYGENFADSVVILKIPENGIVFTTNDAKAFDGDGVIYLNKNGQVVCSGSYSPNEYTAQNAIIIDEKIYSMKGENIGEGIEDTYQIVETYDNGNILVSTEEGIYYTFELETQSIIQEYSYYDREKKLAYVSHKNLTQVFEPSTGEMITMQQSRYYYLDSAIGEIKCYKKNGYSLSENEANEILVKKFVDED